MPEADMGSRAGVVIGPRSGRGIDHGDITHLPMCGRQEDSGVIIMVPPAGREEIGISAATSIGTTRLAVDNTVTLTGRGSTMILLGSTNPPQNSKTTRTDHSRAVLARIMFR